MRRVALIYNPMSGQRHASRAALLDQVVAVFEAAGVTVQLIPTTEAGNAALLAQHAAADGCDTVVACGGDGTVHEALQSMVGGPTVLGVIPLGTANALAADLGLPRDAVKAARLLLKAVPTRVPVGRISFRDTEGSPDSRFFVVAAGAGVDATFFARLNRRMKHRFGYAAYLVAALHLWATHDFPMFHASFSGAGVPPSEAEVSQLLAVRIGNFGGLVRKLAPGAALENEALHVIAFKTNSRLRYLRFMSAVWFARHTYSNEIELLECSTVECGDLPGAGEKRSMVEADGELLGYLPARIEVGPDTLMLLIPPAAR